MIQLDICVSGCVCIYIYIHEYIYVYTHEYMYIYMSIYTYIHVFFYRLFSIIGYYNVWCRSSGSVAQRQKGDTPRPRLGAAARRNYPTSKVRSSGCALLEQPRRDPFMSKVRKTQVRRQVLREGIRGQTD